MYLYIYIILFFRKELRKSCNYHFIFVRQKSVGALDWIFLLLVGRFWEVRSAWAFFVRHCHPVWAADCAPCRPRSVNLWRTGFLAPPTPPCHEAPGSAPPGHAAPPPNSPAPPSYAACTCERKECPRLVSCSLASLFMSRVSERDLWAPSRGLPTQLRHTFSQRTGCAVYSTHCNDQSLPFLLFFYLLLQTFTMYILILHRYE